MGLWGRSNKSVLQRHSGFFVFLKPISYNHKGKKDSDALCWQGRKSLTRQKVFPMPKEAIMTMLFMSLRKRVI